MFGGETFVGFSATAKHTRHKRVKDLESITRVAEQKSHEQLSRKWTVHVKSVAQTHTTRIVLLGVCLRVSHFIWTYYSLTILIFVFSYSALNRKTNN